MKDYWNTEDIEKGNMELWRLIEVWMIFKRNMMIYERVLNYGGYLKEKYVVMKDCWIIEDIWKKKD